MSAIVEFENKEIEVNGTYQNKIIISGFSFHYWPKDDCRDNTKFV
ncbi:MAG: hypothetical protein K0Q73_7145 [Paenibacillus sp.]|nr:hypothetical protein [Paenibacillus sp.]